mgnify:CR=1 FL=1
MKKRGFTLLEMIVAIGVFGIISIIAISALLALISSQRNTAAFQNLQDNVRFAVEVIAKEIRTGRNFWSCGSLPCNEFQFTNIKGERIRYYLKQMILKQ